MFVLVNKSIKSIFKNQQGQALLIVVLVMVVALTVGLSVASRTVINLRTTADEENSQRAFSAAEAGIEQALKTGQSISSPLPLGNNANIENVRIVGVSGTEFLLNGGNKIPRDDGFDLWLASYPDYSNPWPVSGNGFISIYWGDQISSCSGTMPAAIEVVLLIGPKTSPSTKRFAFDPCLARSSSNGFQTASGGTYNVASKTFLYQATIPVPSGTGLLARVIPLYANAFIGVKGCDSSGAGCIAFPPQGSSIDSVGSSGGTKRKITVFQGYPQLPSEFFPYILFQTKQ